MRLDGRRESQNVDDRRGQSGGGSFGSMGGGGLNILGLLLQMFMSGKGGNGGGKKGGCGIIGLVLVVVLVMSTLGGGGLGSILGGLVGGGMPTQGEQTEQTEYVASAEEQELATFARKILAGTEDVWSKIFQQMGRTYQAPKLVLFTDAVQSGCGGASSSTGPFYCSADQTVYLDLSFFMNMKQQIGADGDFAYAYVIAHEVGHHVQYLLGTLNEAHAQMRRVSEAESNQISVRLELQADFYAGVWAYHDNQMYHSLEAGDIEEGLNAAQKIGDDYLQKKARGYTVPESFNHGTSAQRSRWLRLGSSTGDITKGDTFSPSYNSL